MQGHASWKVERDEIVGQPDPGQKTDSWLFSKEEWTDFTLEVEFKVPEKCNSGIAIRMPKEAMGDPDMYGYEVQISDAPGRKPTGSLLHHVDSKGNNVHKPNEWNRMSITCEGDHIVVYLNGQLVVDTKESGSKRGRIGMQVAKGEEFANQEIRFRNIRIKNLAANAPATSRRSFSGAAVSAATFSFTGETPAPLSNYVHNRGAAGLLGTSHACAPCTFSFRL